MVTNWYEWEKALQEKGISLDNEKAFFKECFEQETEQETEQEKQEKELYNSFYGADFIKEKLDNEKALKEKIKAIEKQLKLDIEKYNQGLWNGKNSNLDNIYLLCISIVKSVFHYRNIFLNNGNKGAFNKYLYMQEKTLARLWVYIKLYGIKALTVDKNAFYAKKYISKKENEYIQVYKGLDNESYLYSFDNCIDYVQSAFTFYFAHMQKKHIAIYRNKNNDIKQEIVKALIYKPFFNNDYNVKVKAYKNPLYKGFEFPLIVPTKDTLEYKEIRHLIGNYIGKLYDIDFPKQNIIVYNKKENAPIESIKEYKKVYRNTLNIPLNKLVIGKDGNVTEQEEILTDTANTPTELNKILDNMEIECYKDIISKALKNDTDKKAFELYLKGKSLFEISEILNVTYNAIQKRLLKDKERIQSFEQKEITKALEKARKEQEKTKSLFDNLESYQIKRYDIDITCKGYTKKTDRQNIIKQEREKALLLAKANKEKGLVYTQALEIPLKENIGIVNNKHLYKAFNAFEYVKSFTYEKPLLWNDTEIYNSCSYEYISCYNGKSAFYDKDGNTIEQEKLLKKITFNLARKEITK